MSAEHNNLRQRQLAEQENATEGIQSTQQAQGLEFATVDDLLRHDSEQNPVPPEVGEKLGRSLEAEPKPQQPWYRKLFG
jgi:hypothetical protein